MSRAALTETEVQEQRERICDAARALFNADGIEAVTLRAIAGRLGWSYTTAYRYFDSKDEIIAFLRAAAFERFGAVLEAAIEGFADPEEALRALFHAYIETALAEPETYRLMVDLRQGHDTDNPELAAAKNRALGTCREILQRAITAGLLSPESNVNALAHVFWSGAHGLVSLHLADQLVMGCAIEELVEPLMRTLVSGIGLAPSQG